MKKVPYKIEKHEEGDMFDSFSCSLDMESGLDEGTAPVQKFKDQADSYRAPSEFIIPEALTFKQDPTGGRPSILETDRVNNTGGAV